MRNQYIKSIEIFDKGNSATRLTVTVDGDVRIKIGKQVACKQEAVDYCTFIATEILKRGLVRTYRTGYTKSELARNIARLNKNTDKT